MNNTEFEALEESDYVVGLLNVLKMAFLDEWCLALVLDIHMCLGGA